MDRLVCGDVGFGKTEVALRAAFAVALEGRQALMLVPTTVLAQQHWNTFRERFADFPVRVEMVSRFRKPADVKQVLADFAAGKVDVLIGTHRVLSRDVIPKSLGLVIVDEEQRFGVAQKELLRSLRLEVDVLALTATPIPRTLHMSLAGLRDISIIETPPEGRQAIRTHVGEYDEELIKTALGRELERGGQSFYLHNRVETIEEAATKLQELCPELRFLVAHGQMKERELENRMIEFLRGDADVLVSTTIIESGLDIPQANTLSSSAPTCSGSPSSTRSAAASAARRCRRTPTSSIPTRWSSRPRRGLASRRSPTTRSSAPGFSIAMRDLEIRGAGELLGAEQSGHVAALGFELYVELLNEAVAELQGEPARRRPADPRRRAHRRLHPGQLRRLGGAQDRPAPTAGADRLRGRAPRAAARRGGPVRAAPGAGREPVHDPGGEAEARARGSGLPRLPGRPPGRRAARARLGRPALAALHGGHRGVLDGLT